MVSDKQFHRAFRKNYKPNPLEFFSLTILLKLYFGFKFPRLIEVFVIIVLASEASFECPRKILMEIHQILTESLSESTQSITGCLLDTLLRVISLSSAPTCDFLANALIAMKLPKSIVQPSLERKCHAFVHSCSTDCPQKIIIGLSASISFEIMNWSEYALEL